MNHHRRFWDELLVVLEESLAAFSGVDPELIDASTTISKTCRRDGGKVDSSGQRSALSKKTPKFGDTIKNSQRRKVKKDGGQGAIETRVRSREQRGRKPFSRGTVVAQGRSEINSSGCSMVERRGSKPGSAGMVSSRPTTLG